jgi:2,4-dienoyl-CoA reductase-like NADH-dependent reductase (Old Yellow Enzyme family)
MDQTGTDRKTVATFLTFCVVGSMSLTGPFSPIKLGSVQLMNRFMRSATYECMADDLGFPSPHLFRLIETLASGRVGLVVPGYVYTVPTGRAVPKQTGLYSPEHATVWIPTIRHIHATGARLMFQLAHCDIASDGPRVGPSSVGRFAHALSIGEVDDIANSFIKAAVAAYGAGADGVDLHAAHGYLLALFLSPLLNRRSDRYGGSVEGRVRIVDEIVTQIRKSTDPAFGIGIKMNGYDALPFGVTPKLAAQYVNRLRGKVDFFEISCGLGNGLATLRARPVNRFLSAAASIVNPWHFERNYNLGAAKFIKRKNPEAIIAAVGGWRDIRDCENALKKGEVDLISISRPLIREPQLIKEWQEGRKKPAACMSCNRCIRAEFAKKLAIRCQFP